MAVDMETALANACSLCIVIGGKPTSKLLAVENPGIRSFGNESTEKPQDESDVGQINARAIISSHFRSLLKVMKDP